MITASERLQLLEFWRAVVDPAGLGMRFAIADEISAYTGESRDVVLGRMASGKDDLKTLWLAQGVDPENRAQVQAFYEDQFVEAYELANWHCGDTNGEPPLSYAKAALFARDQKVRRVLDFGSGIGTGSLALASVGCEVHSADIARQLLAFVEFRMTRRGYAPHPIDLTKGELPRTDYYDLITCFDVLEHIPDQLNKLLELQRYVKYGGFIIVNLMDDSSHEDRPMHISSAGNWLRLVRQTGLDPAWTHFGLGLQVLQRRRVSRVRNVIGSAVDRIQRV